MAAGDPVPDDGLGWIDTNPSADPVSTDGVWWRLRRRLVTRRDGSMFFRHEVPTPYIAELGDRSLRRRGEWTSGVRYERGDVAGVSQANTVSVPGGGGGGTEITINTVSQHVCVAAHTSGASNHPVTGADRGGVWVVLYDPLRVGSVSVPGDDSTDESDNDGRMTPLYSITYDDLGSGVEGGDPVDMPGEYTLLAAGDIFSLDYTILSSNWQQIVNRFNSVALFRSDASDINHGVFYEHVFGEMGRRSVRVLFRWADDMWIQGTLLSRRRNIRGDRYHFGFRRDRHRGPASADASTVIPATVSVGFDVAAPPPSVTAPTEPRSLSGTRSAPRQTATGLHVYMVDLTWTAPSSTGGSPITAYEVRYRTRDPATQTVERAYPEVWSRLGPIESAGRTWRLVIREQHLRDYQIQVRAVSAGGEGALAESQWFTG